MLLDTLCLPCDKLSKAMVKDQEAFTTKMNKHFSPGSHRFFEEMYKRTKVKLRWEKKEEKCIINKKLIFYSTLSI